jgi:hypothetical protein
MHSFRSICYHVKTVLWGHLSWAEASGALGDLGTFLPLVVALTQDIGLDLGTTLLFTGVYNVITGLLYNVPVPVQPMKTIAAVALSGSGLTLPEVMAAGIFVSGTVLILGATGLMGVANRLTPRCIIKGMQLGVGLQLGQKGFQMIWYEGDGGDMNSVWGVSGIFVGMFFVVFILLAMYNTHGSGQTPQVGPDKPQHNTVPESSSGKLESEIKCSSSSSLVDSIDLESPEETRDPTGNQKNKIPITVSMDASREYIEAKLLKYLYLCGDKACEAVGEEAYSAHLAPNAKSTNGQNICCLPAAKGKSIPAALVMVVVGIILTFAFDPSIVKTLSMGPSKPSIIVPTGPEWKSGILRAGLPQLPLTTLNSVISVTHLSNGWFPDRYTRPGSIATSVGLMNLVGCWFGAFPSCHGAGGLAAQVRFGARWGTAPVLLGLLKISISLLFGSSLIGIFQAFSSSLLGAMLVFSGIELASVSKGQAGERGMALMLLVATIGMATKNIAIGVLVGLVAAYILALWDYSLRMVMNWRDGRK